MFEQLQCGPLARRGAVLAALTLLSLLAGFSQIKTEGLGWQEAHYLPRLEAVVSGTAPAPWQYRTLTDRLVLAACQQAQDLRVPRPVGSTFVALRLLQNFLLFLAAHAFYRRLGIGAYASVLGLSALAWGMTQANYGSDLAFDAYTDILLYLCAAIALLEKRFRLLVPIAVVAAFNRETSGLLPVMLMAVALVHRSGNGVDRDLLGRGAIALGLFVAIQLGLRLLRGPSDWVEHPSGATPDFGFLAYNLQNDAAWGHSVGVLGIVPVLALVTYRGWHPVLRPLFWSVVPAWILLHLLCAPLDQARVLLLPQVLVFIPAMLCGIRHAHAQQDARPRGAGMNGVRDPLTPSQRTLIAGVVAVLSAYFVHYQITFMGLDWYETVQWKRTLDVIQGESGTPWQYRLFTEGMVYGLVRLFEQIGVARPIGMAFILFRLVQCVLTFTLALLYYRKLGLTLYEGFIGISLLVWGMCHGLYDTDMTFNTYTDMSLFLAAGLLILHGRPGWLIPLMCIAPFNRETSGCIPVMLLFSAMTYRPRFQWPPRRILVIVAVTLLLWVGIVGGLRLVYGLRPYIVPTAGKEPILPLLLFNLTWWRTWVFLFATLGLMPLMALLSWKAWPTPLRRFFWAVVPVWFPVHFALAHAPETRLFLVPQVLIFIPGALLGLKHYARTEASQA